MNAGNLRYDYQNLEVFYEAFPFYRLPNPDVGCLQRDCYAARANGDCNFYAKRYRYSNGHVYADPDPYRNIDTHPNRYRYARFPGGRVWAV